MRNRKKNIEVPVWNNLRLNNYQMEVDLNNEKIVLICPECKSTVRDQPHKDLSTQPNRIQVVCENPECNYNDYRLE